MKGFLRKLFNIYPGEEKNAIFFACLGFLWAFGVTAGLKFADALFLLHVGAEHLPGLYKLTACGMLFLSSFLLYVFHRVSIHKIFISILLCGIFFYSFVDIILYFFDQNVLESDWIWYALRIFGSLFFAVVVTSFWTFVDHHYHLQDAKRVYSLFSSTVFIGIACTGALMQSGWLNFSQVALLIILVLAMTISLILYIKRTIKPIPDENISIGRQTQPETSWLIQIKSILKSRFTLLLMMGNFLTYVLQILTEYNYMSSFEAAFDPQGVISSTGDEQNAPLTKFLGEWIAIVSIANLIFGLFLYSRFVRRFGIGSLVFCTPMILLLTFSGWSISQSLFFPIMGLFVVEGTLYVIDDSNFNLLLNGVPSKLKYKIRLIIESFFEPIGMLTSSFILSVTWIDSRIVGLVLSACLLFVALLLKANYLSGIYRNLAENAIHFHRKVSEWYDLMTHSERSLAKKRLLSILRQGKENLIQMTIKSLVDFNDLNLTKKMLGILDQESIQTKITCLEVLQNNQQSKNLEIWKHVSGWLTPETTLLLRSRILFFLACVGGLPQKNIFECIESPHPLEKGAALIFLKKFSQESEESLMATRLLNEFLNSAEEENICFGLKLLAIDGTQEDIERIIPFLKHLSLKVAQSAADAIISVPSPLDITHAQVFISLLGNSSDMELRLSSLKALGKIGDPSLAKQIITSSIHFRPIERRQTEEILTDMGIAVVPSLLEMTTDIQLHDRCRVLSGRILGHLALSLLRQNLYEIILKEVDRAYFYYYYCHTIQTDYPDLDLHILQDALFTGHRSVIDFIIQLLGVAGELEDCELLSRSLFSAQPKTRSQVLEMLERSCETKIFRLINPLISDLPKEEKLRYYRKKNRILSLNELLDRLEHSSITVDQIVASTLKFHLNLPNWRNTLMKHLTDEGDDNEIFRPFAKELLES